MQIREQKMDPNLKAKCFLVSDNAPHRTSWFPRKQILAAWRALEPTPGLRNATALNLKKKAQNATHSQPVLSHGPEGGSEPAAAALTTLLNRG